MQLPNTAIIESGLNIWTHLEKQTFFNIFCEHKKKNWLTLWLRSLSNPSSFPLCRSVRKLSMMLSHMADDTESHTELASQTLS